MPFKFPFLSIYSACLYRKKLETDLQKVKAEGALLDLKLAQAQFIQSEKMASLGELTAGIAHEIQLPLYFVNNVSEVNKELLVELRAEIANGNYNDATLLAKDVEDNQDKITENVKRAEGIVKSMLQHRRTSGGSKEETDINRQVDESVILLYHGFKIPQPLQGYKKYCSHQPQQEWKSIFNEITEYAISRDTITASAPPYNILMIRLRLLQLIESCHLLDLRLNKKHALDAEIIK